MVIIVFLLAILNCFELNSQVLTSSRSTDWSSAGLTTLREYPVDKIDITELGADANGVVSSYPAFVMALSQLDGKSGVIYFPPGEYFFDQGLILTDSLILQGAGADKTSLIFDLAGTGDLIYAGGVLENTIYALTHDGVAGDTSIIVQSGALWQVGEMAKLYMDDSDLITDSWALNSVAQMVTIIAVEADTLFLDQTLRMDFPISRQSALKKVTPREQIGVECLKIIREDETVGQSKNLFFKYARNCWIIGVESSFCNFGHLVLEGSSHLEVKTSYFHHAFNYGGGGQGYGIVLQIGTNLCLVENNVFRTLRHSMLLQAGANGNVLSFNYSVDPFWSNFPSDAAGDLVCHGNYPFLNLFDHNIVQNIVIDNSHGSNGPFNTFFRNRAELYGIVMTASNSPQQNFIGNEITNTNPFFGNYNLMGAGHFEYANNHQGVIKPLGTGDLMDSSYYYQSIPDFLAPPWPRIGWPQILDGLSIPARDRYLAGANIAVCPNACDHNYRYWKVWTGCANTTNWHDPLNWEGNTVPDASDAVLIPCPTEEDDIFPVLTNSAVIKYLWIQQGAKIEVVKGAELIVLDD